MSFWLKLVVLEEKCPETCVVLCRQPEWNSGCGLMSSSSGHCGPLCDIQKCLLHVHKLFFFFFWYIGCAEESESFICSWEIKAVCQWLCLMKGGSVFSLPVSFESVSPAAVVWLWWKIHQPTLWTSLSHSCVSLQAGHHSKLESEWELCFVSRPFGHFQPWRRFLDVAGVRH